MDVSPCLCYMLAFMCFHETLSVTRLPKNQLLGIKYVSYDNFDGTLATGDCCDEPGKKAGSCTPNLCDTVFRACGSTDLKNGWCNIYVDQPTPVTYNDNAVTFGSRLGNGHNHTASFFVLKFPFVKSNINFTVKASEAPEASTQFSNQSSWSVFPTDEIAEFNFIVDWVDPLFLNPPIFRRQVLNDTRARLVLDIVSQCSKHYFTDDCSVFCRPDRIHFECLDNGTIHCLPGWTGPKCLTMADYCPGNLCQHGSTCVPVFMNYTCSCTPGFSGRYCEISITTKATTLQLSTPTQRPTKQAETATTSQSSDSDDDDNVLALALGLAVGLLSLAAILMGVAYNFIGKMKLRLKVAPEGESTTR